MDNKLFVTIIAVVLVISGVSIAAFNYDPGDGDVSNDNMFNIIARANSEGSGLYIKESVIGGMKDGMPTRNNTPFFNQDWSVSEGNKAAWDGLVFGTPGTSSIQHTQLADLAARMGLDFTLYSTSGSSKDNTLYYDSGITNAGQAITSTVIHGGILWEPQYQLIVTSTEGNFVPLALTNDVFEGHTCCIVAGNTKYMRANESATLRFLAGYVNAVKDVNRILKDTGSNEYVDFVNFVKEKVPALKDVDSSVTKAALGNINYLYSDDDKGNLDKLENDIAELVNGLGKIGSFTKKVSNPQLFAEDFVTHSYIKKAIAGDYSKDDKVSISVAVITGDIHQIAIHWAVEKGYFDDLGVNINIVGSTNGAGVATALVNGEATFGFLGAPPATVTTVNSGYITA